MININNNNNFLNFSNDSFNSATTNKTENFNGSTKMPKLNFNNQTFLQNSMLFDSKLRRQFALEWEYLATILDRVLLIIFSILVIFISAGMLIIGEIINFSYDL